MLHLLLLLMIGMVKRQVHKGKQLQATILMTDLKERSTLSKKTHQVELPNTTNAAEKSEVTDNYFKFYSQTCNFYKKTTLNLLPILKSAHCVLFKLLLFLICLTTLSIEVIFIITLWYLGLSSCLSDSYTAL